MSLPWTLLSRANPLHREPEATPVMSPGHDDPSILEGAGAEVQTGTTPTLSWAARTDIGLVRSHNEDSFLAQAPSFGVCDGMGGHAAGEIASAIAVQVISENAPEHADDLLLGPPSNRPMRPSSRVPRPVPASPAWAAPPRWSPSSSTRWPWPTWAIRASTCCTTAPSCA